MGLVISKCLGGEKPLNEDQAKELASFDGSIRFCAGGVRAALETLLYINDKHQVVYLHCDRDACFLFEEEIANPDKKYSNGTFLYSEDSRNPFRQGKNFYFTVT